MWRGEQASLTLMLIVSAGFAGAAALNFFGRRDAVAPAQARVLHVPSALVIGPARDFSGDPHSPYTLVEFGDYECPPCHAADKRLPGVLGRYRGRLRFAFRNMPLTSIHPYAMVAATAAEAAREQGKFWPTHDGFYRQPINLMTISAVLDAQHLDRARFERARASTARAAVEADVDAARTLDLNATPAFILCTPDGRVLRLQSLDQVGDYVL